MRLRKIEQICEELARTVGAATDSCIVAWDESSSPRIVFATGHTQEVLFAKAGELVGRPAGALFSGGERAARDLAAICSNVPAAEQRPMIRGGQPFAAQLLLRGVNGGAVALVRDLTAGHLQADAALRAEDLARFASLVAHEIRNPLSAVKILCRQAAVATEDAGGGAVEVAMRQLPEGWELSVADPGQTLSPELREKAFVPFTPQRARGSGLGLAVVARIAREHRGEVRLEERPGGGNVISMTFSA